MKPENPIKKLELFRFIWCLHYPPITASWVIATLFSTFFMFGAVMHARLYGADFPLDLILVIVVTLSSLLVGVKFEVVSDSNSRRLVITSYVLMFTVNREEFSLDTLSVSKVDEGKDLEALVINNVNTNITTTQNRMKIWLAIVSTFQNEKIHKDV